MKRTLPSITLWQMIIGISLFYTLWYNFTFFRSLTAVYPFKENIGFVLSTGIVIWALTAFVLLLLTPRILLKPVLITVTVFSSLGAYFMDTYHVVLDESMLRNALQTNLSESLDLVTPKLFIYIILLGLLPAIVIYRTPVSTMSFRRSLIRRFQIMSILLLVIIAALFAYSKHYTSFFREHRPLRYNTNPLYWIYSSGFYLYKSYFDQEIPFRAIGTDAVIPDDGKPPRLVIMVVGEAARADHFSLNGYQRETNPTLAHDDIINFPQMYSCGTSTAYSVPCMFSVYTRDTYSYKKAISTENVIDVLKHTGKVALLWRDNNSDSKGVALRIPHEDYRTPKQNTICVEGECRDIGMLVGLDDFIAKHQGKDILIVLHQMGNHGPAYYKRYTKDFEKYTPVCKSSQLEECKREEIVNAYDNALRYTDNFLAKTIDLLKHYDDRYRTAMLYMSDHGESLGEKGIYLHGLPYFMAPDAQKHIGALFWFGKGFRDDPRIKALATKHTHRFSHDNLFHTLLGIFDVQTKVYDNKLDMLQ